MNSDDKKQNEEKVTETEIKNEVIEEVKTETTDWEEKYKRALADYQNLQRYTREQRIAWVQQASKDIILKLLPVLDTLMLIAKHFEDKSLPLAIGQFLKILEEEGIQKIKTIGEKFDPNKMECVTTKEGEEGKILEELRSGYMLGDTIIRTAQVTVGKSTLS